MRYTSRFKVQKRNCQFCHKEFSAGNIGKHENTCINNPSSQAKNLSNCIQCGKRFKFKPAQSDGQYCSSICSGAHRHKLNIDEKTILFNQGKFIQRRYIYEILIKRDGNKCSSCNITEWNDKPIRLWVDHIDGNATNNNPDNFQLICPNCDSQQETFGAKNKGNGRRSHGLKPYG